MSPIGAWLFPGQGSQYPSMGRSVWNHPVASPVLALAESISGLPLGQVIANGPAALLQSPQYLEPSTTALQIACVELLRLQGLEPQAVAGYSLGEIGALYCAGCLSREAALELASKRGHILQRLAQPTFWRTVAVCFPQAPSAVPLSTGESVFTASFNTPRDITLTGKDEHVRSIETLMTGKRAIISSVAIDGPWHSPLALQCAVETIELIQSIGLQKPSLPVCLASIGHFETETHALQTSFAKGVATPVFFTATLDTLWNHGVRHTLEIAPGRVLTGFIRSHWTNRDYFAQFLEREGGRVIDFERFARQKENGWKRSA